MDQLAQLYLHAEQVIIEMSVKIHEVYLVGFFYLCYFAALDQILNYEYQPFYQDCRRACR